MPVITQFNLNFKCKLIRYEQKNKSDQRDKNRDKWFAAHGVKNNQILKI